MPRRTVTAVSLTLLAVLAVAAPAPAASGDCGDVDRVVTAGGRDEAASAIRCLITRERAAHGARRLQPQANLRRAASRFAATLVRRQRVDHVIPGVPDLRGRLRAAGYRPMAAAGENLAWAGGDLATPRRIVRMWMGSRGHRLAMLNPTYREVGVGLAMSTPEGGDGVTVVALFGKRR